MKRIPITLLGGVLFLPAAALPGSRSAPAPGKGAAPYVTTYDVADLVARTASWQQASGERGRGEGIEALAGLILRTVEPESWREGKEGGSNLQEHNGTRLEIYATEAQHKAIAELLEALRRLADLAVVLQGELCSLDRTFYKTKVESLAAGGPAAVEEDLAGEIRKHAVEGKSSKVTVPNGEQARLFSLRQAFVYTAKVPDGPRVPTEALGTGFRGVRVQAGVVVSPDRRRVRVRLSRDEQNLAGLDRERRIPPDGGKEGTVEVPDVRKSTTASTVEVEDGQWLALPLRIKPLAGQAGDRILVLMVRASIFIEAEEREKARGR